MYCRSESAPGLPSWLSVTVTKHGKSQTLTNTVSTAGLAKGSYHAVVRADNTEPVSRQPMSALYYDVTWKWPAAREIKSDALPWTRNTRPTAARRRRFHLLGSFGRRPSSASQMNTPFGDTLLRRNSKQLKCLP